MSETVYWWQWAGVMGRAVYEARRILTERSPLEDLAKMYQEPKRKRPRWGKRRIR